MKRKILIITNPGEKGDEHYCNGVYVDADNYKSFFKAPYGGYWSEQTEILHLDKPSKIVVNREINELGLCDFSILIFCGHGFYSSHSDSNIIQLNKDDRIDSLDLRKAYNKRIIILDSCREVSKEYITDNVIIKAKLFTESLSGLSKLHPEQCKKYYNQTIENCKNQLIVSYSCNLNEFAGDSSSKGGYYSSSLLKVARKWVDDKIDSIDLDKDYLTVNFPRLHEDSIPLTVRLSSGEQNPQIDKPRLPSTEKYLPFAIIT